MSREVPLNFGRLVVRAVDTFTVYDLHWEVPGCKVDVTGLTLTSLYEAMSTIVDAYAAYLSYARQMDEYISYVDRGWCIAECRSGTWFVRQTCERAREDCEMWQNGFRRFVARDELAERKAMYEETAQKALQDINTIQGAAPPPRLQVYAQPSRARPPVLVTFTAVGRFNRARARLLRRTPTSWVEELSWEALVPRKFQANITEPGEYRMRVEHLTTGEVAEAAFTAESPAQQAPTGPSPPPLPQHAQLALYAASLIPVALSVATAVASETEKLI